MNRWYLGILITLAGLCLSAPSAPALQNPSSDIWVEPDGTVVMRTGPPGSPIIYQREMWVAANELGESTLFFKRTDGSPATLESISPGQFLNSDEYRNVRSEPAGWDNSLFRLPPGEFIRVEDTRLVDTNPDNRNGIGYNKQLWIKLNVAWVNTAFQITALEYQDIYYDEYGLIVHKDRKSGKYEGGDTAQREGWYWFGIWVRDHTSGLKPWQPKRRLSFDQVLRLLEPAGDGVFYRHPKQAPFNDPFSKEWGTSRDQLVPLITAMGVYDRRAELDRLWQAMPEDAVSKHAFNGNWRSAIGQDGWNCTEVKNQSCGPTMDCSLQLQDNDCSLKVDRRSCRAQRDNRDCSIHEDHRNCSQPRDTRNCQRETLGVKYNDPICESEKAAQNQIYAANKLACEAAKASANAAKRPQKLACEAAKEAQNTAYAGEKAKCELEKQAQNTIYAQDKLQCEATKTTIQARNSATKGLCETAKTGGKYACEAYKASATQLCRLTNVHSGDIIGPATINLVRRAMGRNPLLPDPADFLSPTILAGGASGEAELLANTHLRVGASANRDDTGDDLNHILMLVMAKLRFPTPISDNAMYEYSVQRKHSYGSYLDQYRKRYGGDGDQMEERIKSGIARGWQPEVSAPYGAVRWYHRAESGANPALATMYEPIIRQYVK